MKGQGYSTALAKVITLCCGLGVMTDTAIAQSGDSISADPERCVALNEGQVCYQTIELSWRTKNKGDYCIVTSSPQKVIQCWNNANTGKTEFDFESNKDLQLLLVDANSNPVANTSVVIAWVYKKNNKRKATWRLF